MAAISIFGVVMLIFTLLLLGGGSWLRTLLIVGFLGFVLGIGFWYAATPMVEEPWPEPKAEPLPQTSPGGKRYQDWPDDLLGV